MNDKKYGNVVFFEPNSSILTVVIYESRSLDRMLLTGGSQLKFPNLSNVRLVCSFPQVCGTAGPLAPGL